MKVSQSCPILCDPTDYTVHGILQARILKWVAFPFSRRSFQPKDQTQGSHTLQEDFLPAEPQGKPKNTGVGSLSLLQRIFPTQESNQGLLHWGGFFTNWAIGEPINIQYLFFSFWLTSLCIIGSRFIHLIGTDPNTFSFWLNNIPLYICTTTSLSIHLLTNI